MQLSDEDMKALSTISVESLELTKPQKRALGKLVQSVRGFMATVQELDAAPEGKPFKPEVVK